LYEPGSKFRVNSTLIQVNFTRGVDTSSGNSLPRDIIGFSIEFCYIGDYLGDVGSPNNLSLSLLSEIQSIIGTPPTIRLGGNTQDVAQYHPENNITILNTFKPGDTEAISVSFGNGLFEVRALASSLSTISYQIARL
jgi:hypothetical protein